MFDSSQVPSYIILRGLLGIYAHVHFSKMVLTMDAQKIHYYTCAISALLSGAGSVGLNGTGVLKC